MTGPLAADDVVGGRYRVLSYHAQGGMQYVYRAQDVVAGREVALKTPKNHSASKRFRRSATVAARVNHPNVAKTLDYLVDAERRFLVEEFVEGDDLASALLGRLDFLDPYLSARIFHHAAKGVAAAHHAGVIHRDLKPTNIMVSGGYNLSSLKVTDFGVAKLAGDLLEEAAAGGGETMLLSQTAVGALPYMAPEAIDPSREVTQKSDVWSLGAMMYHIATGIAPFGTGLMAVQAIMSNEPLPVPDFIRTNAQFAPLATQVIELASLCLNKDPARRPTCDELVQRCGEICSSSATREVGVVRRVESHRQWGFIRAASGDVFYHASCVFGPTQPEIGDEVMFTRHEVGGSAAPRAYPVIRLRSSSV